MPLLAKLKHIIDILYSKMNRLQIQRINTSVYFLNFHEMSESIFLFQILLISTCAATGILEVTHVALHCLTVSKQTYSDFL